MRGSSVSYSITATATAALTITTDTGVEQGTYTVTIRGMSGTLSRSTQVTLQVKRK